ncbi:hypothetical protein [Klenkia sp. PcliD-1-E]|uniref:hypothetical protein n=1 Tax=Klenkia sp. PcliD-1-E TaxID=2954492 RepID=UPI0020985E0C|nr:hypothetical protein [Klenkia sp. PcliD-1-E]MCO7218496.1 hypothetical protein [Klenkia sp. PcliD-1-E]
MDDQERVVHGLDLPATTEPGATHRKAVQDSRAHRRQTAALDALAAIELDRDASMLRSS